MHFSALQTLRSGNTTTGDAALWPKPNEAPEETGLIGDKTQAAGESAEVEGEEDDDEAAGSCDSFTSTSAAAAFARVAEEITAGAGEADDEERAGGAIFEVGSDDGRGRSTVTNRRRSRMQLCTQQCVMCPG